MYNKCAMVPHTQYLGLPIARLSKLLFFYSSRNLTTAAETHFKVKAGLIAYLGGSFMYMLQP